MRALLQIVLVLAVLLPAALPCLALEVHFQPVAVVDQPTISLGDIADFSAAGETARALASQIVAQAPAPGEELLLHTPSVIRSLHAGLALPEDIQWHGAAAVTVQRQGITIGPDRLEAIIAEYLESQKANLPEAEIRFLPQSLPLPFVLPTGDLRYEVIPANPAIIGSARMAIIFRVDGRVVKNISLLGQLEALAQVVVSTKALAKGTILHPDQLTTVTMDLTGLNGASSQPAALFGKRLTRSLRSGSPVLATMIEELPLVRRGEPVRIVLSAGPMQLTALGLAHSDGRPGEVIRVQNSSSNKILHCRVTAPGQVEVIL
jgi:flagellar basal body P-ring formation protein FlgA